MCGRFTITRRDGNSLAAELGVPADSFVDYRPRYNVAPTQKHFIVRIKYENREVIPATWGLIRSGSKDASMASKTINTRSETIDTRGAFRARSKSGDASCPRMVSSSGPGRKPRGSPPGSIARTAG
jgi:putative SOS response-associated peptidase YedK